jgi:hypothetical protein
MAGIALDTRRGGRATMRVQRVNAAERIARLTGEGGWRDSALLGEPIPASAPPPLNAQVLGQDSVQTALYRGAPLLVLGAIRSAHPTRSATFAPPAPRPTPSSIRKRALPIPTSPGPTASAAASRTCRGRAWSGSTPCSRFADGPQGEKLVAHYSRMKSLGERLEHGLALWNDGSNAFEKAPRLVRVGVLAPSLGPGGPRRARRRGLALLRPAVLHGASARALGPRSAIPPNTRRGRQDRPGLAGPRAGRRSRRRTSRCATRPAAGVTLHAGSVAWNAWARLWLMIAVESGGESSFLGDVWLATADAPEGPWQLVRRVIQHDRYSFYNPVHHAFLDREGGRIIYFEGTYAETFSGAPAATPGRGLQPGAVPARPRGSGPGAAPTRSRDGACPVSGDLRIFARQIRGPAARPRRRSCAPPAARRPRTP